MQKMSKKPRDLLAPFVLCQGDHFILVHCLRILNMPVGGQSTSYLHACRACDSVPSAVCVRVCALRVSTGMCKAV